MPPTRGKNAAGSGVFDGISKTLNAQMGGRVELISANRAGTDDLGNPIYFIRYQFLNAGPGPGSVRVNRTVTFQGGKIGKPQLKGRGTPSPGKGAGTGGGVRAEGDLEIQNRKDAWLSSVAGHPLLTDAQKADLSSRIDEFTGGPQNLNNMVKRYIESVTNDNILPPKGGFEVDLGGGGGGGGGGGFTGPEYVAPDERVVEDFVKGTMISLVGAIDDDLVQALKSVYMKDHRRNFDNPNQEIDPSQSVLERLRQTEQYEEIHQLRPDSEDERQWIAQRRAAAQQGGLQTGEREDFAIQQASIGGDLPDVADAASVAQFQKTGSARGTRLEDKIRATATNIFRGVA